MHVQQSGCLSLDHCIARSSRKLDHHRFAIQGESSDLFDCSLSSSSVCHCDERLSAHPDVLVRYDVQDDPILPEQVLERHFHDFWLDLFVQVVDVERFYRCRSCRLFVTLCCSCWSSSLCSSRGLRCVSHWQCYSRRHCYCHR